MAFPSTLGHYRIVGLLGRGGMGEVHAAEDTKLRRPVALKVLPPGVAADPAWRERFQREARAIAAVNHPGIVTIHSIEEVDDVQFPTMELVEGETLDMVIARRLLTLAQILAIAIRIADALSAAHQRGIVHSMTSEDTRCYRRKQ